MKLDQYKLICKPMYAEMEAVFAKYGLKPTKTSAGVEESAGTVRLTFLLADTNLKAADGSATTPDQERWKSNARLLQDLYGIDPAWLGTNFVMGPSGTRYQVAGLLGGRSTKCIAITRSDGKGFKIDPKSLVRAMGGTQPRTHSPFPGLTIEQV